MSWYAWSVVWWVGLGAVLAIATNSGTGWRKWWVRVAALLISLTTLDQFGSVPPADQLLTWTPNWLHVFGASLQGCDGVGTVAGVACTPSVTASAESSAPVVARP